MLCNCTKPTRCECLMIFPCAKCFQGFNNTTREAALIFVQMCSMEHQTANATPGIGIAVVKVAKIPHCMNYSLTK